MHQMKYSRDLLNRFEMKDCNAAVTPTEMGLRLERGIEEEDVDHTEFRRIIGSLRYLCNTRPDLSYGVGIVSRHMQSPKVSHMNAVKRILRYLRGTCNLGIMFPCKKPRGEMKLVGFADADRCGDMEDRKSTAGHIFYYGKGLVSWNSVKEPVVALSSCEAEYIAVAQAACQAAWLRMLLKELNAELIQPPTLFVDNKSAIDLAKHPSAHGKSKHIEMRFHFLRKQVNDKKLEVEHCSTEDQSADIFTKPLKAARFCKLRESLGIVRF